MINQHFYPESERKFYECLICKEAIYNPLCQNCITTHLSTWIVSYPNLKKKLMPKVKSFLQAVNNESAEGDSLSCISCKRKKAAICPYCFTEFILSQLKKIKAHKNIVGEFLHFFNFDYDNTGYSNIKEAEI